MAKDIRFNDKLREGMLAGISNMANAIKITLGPKGRNVMMYQPPNLHESTGAADPTLPAQPGAPAYVTNDGVTIARSIAFQDPYENLGAELLKEAAIKTNDEAGDGTTTAVILTHALIEDGIRNVVAGAHPLAIQRGMKSAADVVIDELHKMSKAIKTRDEISQVASISCQDEAIGNMIGEAFDRVGLEGVVKVDTLSKSGRPELEVLEGIVFERGYLHELMINDKDKRTAELYDPYILITDFKIDNPNDILDILIAVAEQGKGILIIADAVEGEAMTLILKNRMDGDIDMVAIHPPMYGEGRQWRLEDLAIQTGGRFTSKDKGDSLREVTLEDLGSASYVQVAKKQTIITGAKGDPKEVDRRIKELRHLVDNTDYEFNRERYKERLAKFVSGVATVQAGGDTEVEIKEQKLRIEDAINAARAAIQEGIVPGGGIALLDAIPAVTKHLDELEGDERIGAEILMNALDKPCYQVALNAGLNAAGILAEIRRREPGTGYDASSMNYVNMIDAGVVDPVKVTRLALESAVSVSSILLTSNAGVSESSTKNTQNL